MRDAPPGPDPHAATPPAAAAPPAAPSFYKDRPGAAFVIAAGRPFPARADEPHLSDVRQLTFSGENAEAYFSPDGTLIVWASNRADPASGQTNLFVARWVE